MKKLSKIIGTILMFLFFSSFALSIVHATTPTIAVQRIANQENSKTNKWAWVFKITTTNISDKTNILVNIYKDGVLDTEQVEEKVSNNEALYYTDSVLNDGSNYKITFQVENSDLKAEYSAIVGSSDKEEVVYFNPKTGTEDSGVYKLLAPIGKLTEAPTNMGDYFNIIFKLAIGLCGALAVIMIIIGGVQYMGDESIFGKTEAKSRIMSAILGLLIALGSWALLNTINPDLLGGGGVNIKQVSAEIDDETETSPWSEGAVISGTTNTCKEGYINVNTYGDGSLKNPKTINVCKSISTNLKNMIDKAKNDGIIISGYGSRSYDQQVRLREAHNCPDIYKSPSNMCRPPTARPGHSKHESGKAVDFTCNGKSMVESGGKNSVCFVWLSKNAKTYGFYNLKSESWHWSDDGR